MFLSHPIPPVTPIPAAQAWTVAGPSGVSSFTNVTGLEPAPPNTLAGDVPGCYWDIPNTVTLAANGAYPIPSGAGYLVTGSTVNGSVVQLQVGAVGTWVTIKSLNVNDAWFYDSDFGNIRILNGVSGTTVITLYPSRRR